MKCEQLSLQYLPNIYYLHSLKQIEMFYWIFIYSQSKGIEL